jgi:hypothetical protein
LQSAIAGHPAGVELLLWSWSRKHDSYVADRASRLLSAAAAGGSVAPMPRESADLFARERELGHMPLRDAFAHLAALDRALGELEHEVVSGRLKPDPEKGFMTTEIPLGRTFAYTDPLLRSDLSLSIAVTYLEALAGGGDLDTPFFSMSRRKGISTGMLLGRPQKPPGH